MKRKKAGNEVQYKRWWDFKKIKRKDVSTQPRFSHNMKTEKVLSFFTKTNHKNQTTVTLVFFSSSSPSSFSSFFSNLFISNCENLFFVNFFGHASDSHSLLIIFFERLVINNENCFQVFFSDSPFWARPWLVCNRSRY